MQWRRQRPGTAGVRGTDHGDARGALASGGRLTTRTGISHGVVCLQVRAARAVRGEAGEARERGEHAAHAEQRHVHAGVELEALQAGQRREGRHDLETEQHGCGALHAGAADGHAEVAQGRQVREAAQAVVRAGGRHRGKALARAEGLLDAPEGQRREGRRRPGDGGDEGRMRGVGGADAAGMERGEGAASRGHKVRDKPCAYLHACGGLLARRSGRSCMHIGAVLR